MQPEISIIMPVYNIEKYLSKTIESVLAQTFDSFELIIIDDKSKDNTLSVAENYASKDSRIRIIKLEENKKQGNARNIGLNLSIGKYIMFLDGDDIADINFLKKMYNSITTVNADISMCNFEVLDDKTGKTSDQHVFGAVKNLSNQMLINGFAPINIKEQIFTIPNIIWNKIYKKEYLINKKILFPTNITICEDIIFGISATVQASKLAYVDEKLILYRRNRKNSSSNDKDKTFFDIFYQYEYLRDIFEKNNIYELYKIEFIKDLIYTMLFFLKEIKLKYKAAFYKKMQEVFKIYFEEEFSSNDKILQFDPDTYNHVINIVKNSYFKYKIFEFLSKIIRIKKWINGEIIIIFSKYEFWRSKS